jgi:hypothetical protein
VSNETPTSGLINPYGDLSRRARRELEAQGINPDEAVAAYNQTGDIAALTGSITIIAPASAAVESPTSEPEPGIEPEPVTEVAPVVSVEPAVVPVSTGSIFPQTLSRRDEVIIEQRRTAEITVVEPVPLTEQEPEVQGAAEAEAEVLSVDADEVIADDVIDEQLEEEFEEQIEAEVVPIDLEPVEIEAVRIDQREDREEITNEFEPFTITTTTTGIIPTTSHALVLPSLPEEDPALIASLNETGEIVITGQITLPSGIAQIGADTASLDTADLDIVVEDDEVGSGQDLAPVSASQAVSSFTGTAISVTTPKRTSEKLPFILSIAAAVLALGVVGLLIANYFLR